MKLTTKLLKKLIKEAMNESSWSEDDRLNWPSDFEKQQDRIQRIRDDEGDDPERSHYVQSELPIEIPTQQSWREQWRFASVPKDYKMPHPSHPDMGPMTSDQHFSFALDKYGFHGSRGYVDKLSDIADNNKDAIARAFVGDLEDRLDKYFG